VLLNMHDLALAERFFARWGSATVLICRLLPFVRSFIAFPAGVARMPLGKFHLYTFIGSWPWCFGLAWVGMKLGAAWHTDPRLSHILHGADALIVVLLAIGVGLVLWHKLKARRAR
jgi:membrane protein DedA with SNARE-associated domain